MLFCLFAQAFARPEDRRAERGVSRGVSENDIGNTLQVHGRTDHFEEVRLARIWHVVDKCAVEPLFCEGSELTLWRKGKENRSARREKRNRNTVRQEVHIAPIERV